MTKAAAAAAAAMVFDVAERLPHSSAVVVARRRRLAHSEPNGHASVVARSSAPATSGSATA